jgi:ABC-type uncharacterized transport system
MKMAADSQSKPSFSPGRKWSIAFDVVVRTLVVIAFVVMLNYLSGRYFHRFYLSSQTRVELSPRTVNILKSITNDVKVTLYFDKEEALYSTVTALLNEYRSINPRITIESVDYQRDAAEAQRVKNAYKLSTTPDKQEKNVVIFDCEGRWKIASGKDLAEYLYKDLPSDPGDTKPKYNRKLVAFNGEMMFTSMLFAVTNPKQLRAYFLEGHGEHQIDSADEVSGYMAFATVLQQNYILAVRLPSLLGTNAIPDDCNLLVIAGPTTAITDVELEKIQHHLEHGRRLLVLFNSFARERQTGLEKILALWGVIVGNSVVRDADNSVTGSDVIVSQFSHHPVVNPIINARARLHLIMPRSISAKEKSNAPADAPKVEEIAFSGERAVLEDDPTRLARSFPLIVAVEKGAVKGVITEGGSTRLVVAGDSYFLGNRQIDSASNRDFAGYAANWLLDRSQLLEGLGPRPVAEFRINMTHSQLQTVQWIFLAAMPGAVLVLGAMVWVARRK